MVRNGSVFPVEKEQLKKVIDPHNLLVFLPLVKAIVADEGSFDILDDLGDPEDKEGSLGNLQLSCPDEVPNLVP
jgi:hypothetical protein